MTWTTHHHCGFFSIFPLLSSLAKDWTGNYVFPAGESDFGFLIIPIVTSFCLKFSCPSSWRFILSLHLQLSVIIISVWFCPSICQNFLLIAIYIAFHVFFPFMLSLICQNLLNDCHPHNKTKYVSQLKKIIIRYSKIKQVLRLPSTRCHFLKSLCLFFSFIRGLLFILEQLATYFWHTDSWRTGKCTVPCCRYMLLMDVISPAVQLKGTESSCGVVVQPSFIKQSHILPWCHGLAHIRREEIRAYREQHCSQFVWCKYQVSSLPHSRVCPVP